MYSPIGLMRVTAERGAWTLAPMHALWIPPGITHEVRMVGEVSMRSAYIDPDVLHPDWEQCCILPLSPLMRELILMLHTTPSQQPAYEMASQLLLNLLGDVQRNDSHLPMPQDRRLRRLCAAIIDHPENQDSLDDWGTRIGASGRTLARRMKLETGMSFHHWRLQLRINEAVCRIAEGDSVSAVARALGYRSASAFVYMFRSLMGESPAQYLERTLAGEPVAP